MASELSEADIELKVRALADFMAAQGRAAALAAANHSKPYRKAFKPEQTQRFAGEAVVDLLHQLGMSGPRISEEPVQFRRRRGVVKWFNDAKGYGVIEPDDGGEDLFVHHSQIIVGSVKLLGEGVRVDFEIVEEHGAKRASNVIPKPDTG